MSTEIKMMTKRIPLNNAMGFTIVELMISLGVLSVILVIATIVLIQVGNLYTKGVNGAHLQNTTRNIVADVSSALQFSGKAPTACKVSDTFCSANVVGAPLPDNGYSFQGNGASVVAYAYCIDTTRYSFVLNRELGTDSAIADPAQATTPHVLWRDTLDSSSDPCIPVNMTLTKPTANGFEMTPSHIRLTRFKVQPTSDSVYKVDVWMAYGDSDLVVTNKNPNDAQAGHSICSGASGTQYCAVSEISTALTRRAL